MRFPNQNNWIYHKLSVYNTTEKKITLRYFARLFKINGKFGIITNYNCLEFAFNIVIMLLSNFYPQID